MSSAMSVHHCMLSQAYVVKKTKNRFMRRSTLSTGMTLNRQVLFPWQPSRLLRAQFSPTRLTLCVSLMQGWEFLPRNTNQGRLLQPAL